MRFRAEVVESGTAGDHKAVGDTREVGGQILGDRVSEIFLFRDRLTNSQKATQLSRAVVRRPHASGRGCDAAPAP